MESFHFSFFSICGWGINLDYCDPSKWFDLVKNRNHFVIFETAPILDIFVDYEGYSISSKGFLPTVVDIMVDLN